MMAAAVAAAPGPCAAASSGIGLALGIDGISGCPVFVLANEPWRTVCRVLPLFSAPLLSLAASWAEKALAAVAMICF
jgi:hypothetical protein